MKLENSTAPPMLPVGRAASPVASNGARNGARGRRLRWVLALIAGALIIILIGVQLHQFRQNQLLRERLQDSYAARSHLDAVLSLHQDLETGQRGFVLTGNPEFLQPYLVAKARLEQSLGVLRTDWPQPPGNRLVGGVEEASADKVRFSERVIALGRQGKSKAARDLIATGAGQSAMDRIRILIAELRQIEDLELQALLQARSARTWLGQPFGIAVQLLLVCMLAGAYIAYLANLRRRELASASAQYSSARQAAIFDAATDAILVVDQQGSVQSANPAARRLFGIDNDQLVGSRVDELFEGATIYIAGLNDRRSNPREESAVRNLAARRGDGSTVYAEVTTSPVEFGQRMATVLIVRDATERTRLERTKNEFVSTVSHELRTPLTSIRGALGLLEHGIGATLDERPRQLLGIAKSNSERLSVLIDDILDVEKLDSGSLELNMQPVDLRTVLEKAEEEARPYAAGLGVRLVVTAPKQPLIATADSGRLLQALTNLISNAAKFSPNDAAVSLTLERTDGWARMGVADRGPGIPVEFRPRLFERFSQAADGQQRGRSGTGLGLAISKAIVERHGGRIDYMSQIGKGTQFWIELPLAEGAGQ